MSSRTASYIKSTTFAQDDLIFHPMDLPNTCLYFSEDVDVPSSAIPINTSSSHSLDVNELFPELNMNRYEKLLSSSPNTFVNSEYGSLCVPSAGQPSSSVPTCHADKVVPDNVRLRNHDCMWSGRCNQQESHQQKMKLKAAAAAAVAAQNSKLTTATTPTARLITPAQSPTKVRTIQAGESLLRLKQPTKGTSSGNNSGDENNNNRPDTPQSLGNPEEQEITATTTGSNHLPLMSQKEQELMKIKEFLSDTTKQYKAYDNTTTLADVINTLEREHISSTEGASGGGNAGGQTVASGGGVYPMSPAEDSDCSRSSMSHVVDDDTESEHEMDDEYSLHDDDEGISLKMMPTSHLSSSSRLGYETSSMSRMSMSGRLQAESEEDTEEEDTEEEDDDEEEDDLKPDVNELMSQNAMYHHHQQRVGEDEEDSGTERSLYGTSLTAQEKSLIMQQTSMHSDHCYTRVKSRVESQKLGVDTPSDSEEEIDVGGVGQKNLPTNPSARDRKALQATVRNRFGRQTSGIMTAPPTVPNSGATTPGGRNAYYQNTIYAGYGAAQTVMQAVATTKKMSHKQQQQQRQMAKLDDYYDQESNSNSSISSSGRKIVSTQSHRKGGSAANRKRPASSAMGYSKSTKHYHDSKKSKYSGSANGKGGARSMQKGYGAGDYRNPVATFSLDKRNLHNDLERQRRVGLKNLFEELKCQIPSLRDKERAPKVSILREAAQLCMELTREQETLFMLRKQREKLLHTARTLKTQLQRAAQRSK